MCTSVCVFENIPLLVSPALLDVTGRCSELFFSPLEASPNINCVGADNFETSVLKTKILEKEHCVKIKPYIFIIVAPF